MENIHELPPVTGVFSPDCDPKRDGTVTPGEPLTDARAYLRPADDRSALLLGDTFASRILENRIADFERGEGYCARRGESDPDRMVHVSTFVIIEGVIYCTYYANTSSDAEDPNCQEARLAFCPVDDPEDLTVITLQKVGDMLDGRTVTRLYDTILLYDGGDELFLAWTASPDGNYSRLYRTYNFRTATLGPIRINRFAVGNVTNDFSITGMQSALTACGIPYKSMWSDIGIMQKLTTRVENGVKWYYTGAYSGNFNCVIKSRDFVTWEYVSTPDFPNLSQWENAVYVLGDKLFYFVRQKDCGEGFLTVLHLDTGEWEKPVLIADAQSRSDFFFYRGVLYLVHAPIDRCGFGIVKIDTDDIAASRPVAVARLGSSCFYPFVRVVGDELYMSYTVDRKHIRLAKTDIREISDNNLSQMPDAL